MTERIIKTPMEVTGYVNQVRALGDANRSMLGFLPSSAYSDAATKGRLWIAVEGTRQRLAGICYLAVPTPISRCFRSSCIPSRVPMEWHER